ncbi:HEAT repeat-containing protein 1-like [Glandiceps talaboti]
MTSLASQLKRLALPQTQSSLTRDRDRASLLFDPKEAASLDRETFYALGVNGLEELIGIDPTFHEFEVTLFDEASKSLERSVQTSEINKVLNKKISQFLLRVSSYFLLKPAQKAIEWLIHRFYIHQYNVDDVMMCILPYHETNIFVRMVQLLKLSDQTNKWHWLEPLQKPGVPLARSTLVNHCYKDMGFQHFICEMVPKALKAHGDIPTSNISSLRVLLSFYATTIVGAIELTGNVTEKMVSGLIPYILKGLKSESVDYKAASYMIVCELVVKVTMKMNLLGPLIKAICRNMKAKLTTEAVTCVTVICQSQKVNKLPKKAFKNLCKLTGFVQILEQLSMSYNITPFMKSYLPRLVKATNDEGVSMATSSEGEDEVSQGQIQYGVLLENIIHDVAMETEVADFLVRLLLEEFMEFSQAETTRQSVESRNLLETKYSPIMQAIERRFPISMDRALEEVMTDITGKEERDILQQFLSLSVSGTKYQVVPKCETSLMLSLNHPSSKVRLLGVKHLQETVEHGTETSAFLQESLLQRLADDEPLVVKTVLDLKEKLLDVIPGDKLFSLLNDQLHRYYEMSKNKTWWSVTLAVVDILCSQKMLHDCPELTDRCMLAVLPYLYLVNTEQALKDVQIAEKIATSALGRYYKLLIGISGEYKSLHSNDDTQTMAAVNDAVIQQITHNILTMEEAQQKDMIQLLKGELEKSSFHCRMKYMTMFIFSNLITLTAKRTLEVDIAHLLMSAIRNDVLAVINAKPKISDGSESDDIKHEIEDLMFEEIHSKVFVILKEKPHRRLSTEEFSIVTAWILHTLLSNVFHANASKVLKWWTLNSTNETHQKYTSVLLNLFDLLTSGSADSRSPNTVSAFRKLLTTLIKNHLNTCKSLWAFLAAVWTSDGKERPLVSTVMKIRALHVCNASFGNLNETGITNLTGGVSVVIPSLLAMLSCPIQPMRETALLCIGTISKLYKDTNTPYLMLLRKLLKQREEIKADPNHLVQAFGVMFAKVGKDTDDKALTPKKKTKRKDLESCLDWLLFGIVQNNMPHNVQQMLLNALSQVNNKMMLEKPLPILESLIKKAKDTQTLTQHESMILNLILKQYSEKTVDLLEKNSKPLKLLHQALSLTINLTSEIASPQETALQQITKQLFSAIKSDEVQQHLLSVLFDLILNTRNAELAGMVNKTLKGLQLEAGQITTELKKIFSSAKATSVKQVKRLRRQEGQSSDSNIDSKAWQRVTLILEFLQHKKKISDCQQLFRVLFQLLSKCLDVEISEQGSIEYVKQLILGCIHGLCERLSPDNKPLPKHILSVEQFNVDLIIQCIRVSDNPQTHHHAMLLLACAAGLFPEHVLHNIMSIFTFMGANLLRQDDSYSFQVINKIVQTIIPVLIKASEEDAMREKLGGGIEDVVVMVTRVFVDALPHIPAHRQLPVLTQLLDTLGSDRFLWTVVILLLASHVCKKTDNSADSENKAIIGAGKDIELCLSVCHYCTPGVQVKSLIQILQYLNSLPEDKDDKPALPGMLRPGRTPKSAEKKKTEPLFNVERNTSKQLRQFKYVVVSFLPQLLASTTFVSQIAELSEDAMNEMKVLYQSLLEENLRYMAITARSLEANHEKPSVKFWRALLHKAYDILDKVNALLPTSAFITVVSGLMHHSAASVRRKAMELLNNKLAQHREPFTEQQVSSLLNMVDELVSVAKATQAIRGDMEELNINKQTALYSLKLLCKIFGLEHPKSFTPVIEVVTRIFSSENSNPQVAASALLCLAELCTNLKAHNIPYLSKFMPPLLEVLDNNESTASSDLFQLSAVTALHKVVDNLPHFLSPYLLDILKRVSALSTIDNDDKSQLNIRLKAICDKLSNTVATRILLPAVTQCYHDVVDSDAVCIGPLMKVLGESISTMQKEDLTSHQSTILTLFLTALDYRATHTQSPLDVISSIEGDVIEAFLSLVMKSSEASFKPVFFKLYDWATRSDAPKDRLVTFYRLSNCIADKLKGLFTLFAGHLVKNSASLLNDNNLSNTDVAFFGSDESSDAKSSLLLQYIIDCLHKCFLYDTEGFMNKDRFDCLMQPLVDQIDNFQGGADIYQERITSHLTPCIGQLTIAVGDDTSWKPLNYQVLLKTRSDSAKVRFAALSVLQEIHNRLNEDFQILVPETIPFLAELLEDESEEVEKQCRQVIEEIEKTIGESLQKYF